MRNPFLYIAMLLIISTTHASAECSGSTESFTQPGYVTNDPGTACPGMGELAYPATIGAGPATTGPNVSYVLPMPVIAVDEDSVYIVRGDQLLKYNKDNLHLVNNTTLQGTLPSPGDGSQSQARSGSGPSKEKSKSSPPEKAAPLGANTPRPQIQSRITRMRNMSPSAMEESYLVNMYQAHLGATAWSRLAETRAHLPQLRQLAKTYISEATSVNSKLSDWCSNWYNTTPPHAPMSVDTDELNKLQGLHGNRFDLEYARAMITSLSEAIDMSQLVVQNGVHSQLRALAADMIKAHTRERQRLHNLIASVYNVQLSLPKLLAAGPGIRTTQVEQTYTLEQPEMSPALTQPIEPGSNQGLEEGAGPSGAAPANWPQAIAFDDAFIYIASGNRLLKLDKQTMKLAASADIPEIALPTH